MLPIVPLHRCGPSENDTQISGGCSAWGAL